MLLEHRCSLRGNGHTCRLDIVTQPRIDLVLSGAYRFEDNAILSATLIKCRTLIQTSTLLLILVADDKYRGVLWRLGIVLQIFDF